MTPTGRLGTNSSVVGLSMALGFAGAASVKASSSISVAHAATLTAHIRKPAATNALTLSQLSVNSIIRNKLMTLTGQLGTSDSVIGLTMDLGAGAGGTGATLSAGSSLSLGQSAVATGVGLDLSATSALGIGQTPTVVYVPVHKASSANTLSQSAAFVGPRSVAAASALSLGQSVYRPATIVEVVSQAITLGQGAEKYGDHRLSAASPITLGQILDNTSKDRDATSQIIVGQSATVDKVKIATSAITLGQSGILGQITVSAFSLLMLGQSASPGPRSFGPGAQIDLPATQISLGQSAKSSIRPLSALSTIAVSQIIAAKIPKHLAATSVISGITQSQVPFTLLVIDTPFGLDNSATVSQTATKPIHQYLQLAQSANVQYLKAGSISLGATSALSLGQSAVLSTVVDATSPINLSHTATGDVGKVSESDLSLASTATFYNIHAPESVTSAIALADAATFILELGNTRFLYAPFVGSSSDPNAPTPPPATLAFPLASQPSFRLVYPSTGLVTDALTVRAPNLGNKDRLAFNRINRETRGGKLIVFADPIWPKSQTMVVTFSALHKAEAYAMLLFIQNHIGQQVGIVDWEHYYWIGVITNPNDPIVQDSRDSFTASFEFEGVHATWTEQTIPDTSLGCSSTSFIAVQNRMAENTCDCTVNTQTQGSNIVANSAETDVTVTTGSAVYITGVGHLALAQANGSGTMQVAGLCLGDFTATTAAQYLTEGEVTRNDWTVITGSAALLPGRVYFLDPATAGRLTAVAPSSTGQYIVPVGRALSTITLDIELTPSILL